MHAAVRGEVAASTGRIHSDRNTHQARARRSSRRRLALGVQSAGSYVASAPLWDGRDDAGRAVPTGMYFVRYVVDGQERGSQRLVIVR